MGCLSGSRLTFKEHGPSHGGWLLGKHGAGYTAGLTSSWRFVFLVGGSETCLVRSLVV